MSTAVKPNSALIKKTLAWSLVGHQRVINALTKEVMTHEDLTKLLDDAGNYLKLIEEFVKKTRAEISATNIINAAPRRQMVTREEIDQAREAS